MTTLHVISYLVKNTKYKTIAINFEGDKTPTEAIRFLIPSATSKIGKEWNIAEGQKEGVLLIFDKNIL
jgi:hypothetical protein